MCGIWGHIGGQDFEEARAGNDPVQPNENKDNTTATATATAPATAAAALVHRGPDETRTFSNRVARHQIQLVFHRLAIIDILNGHQPFVVETETRTVALVANGEIYNYKRLCDEYDLHTTSDCRVILDLYLVLGASETCRVLDGEFAFALVDIDKDKFSVFLARDRFGIRPLFVAFDAAHTNLYFSSEMKALSATDIRLPGTHTGDLSVAHVPPRTVLRYDFNAQKESFSVSSPAEPYYNLRSLNVESPSAQRAFSETEWCERIRSALIESVRDRLNTERPLGCLLSGGLDSSLVAGISAHELRKKGVQLHTFSIGLSADSPDVVYARLVASHIGSRHHEVIVPQSVWLEKIPQVIRQIETYDTTTVRASTGQYLLSQWISKNTDVKVILNGDGSDEIAGGYLYFYNAPDDAAFHNECLALLGDIHYYDVLRVDRGISAHGLEARVPFLAHSFVETYLQSPVHLRRPVRGTTTPRTEKYLLRKSFEGTGLIPDAVLWRRKEAFSDGVSSQQKSWYELIEESIPADFVYDPWDGMDIAERITGDLQSALPVTRESQYYKSLFDSFFPGRAGILETKRYWLPKWCGAVVNPSARVLSIYNDSLIK